MFGIKEFDITKANNYRYTLIRYNMCFDFIVRDGKMYFVYEAKPFGVFDPRLNDTNMLRCKCDLDDGCFTHFIMRTKPYFDVLEYTKDMDNKTIIIQDFTKEINITTTFKPLPEYHNIQNLFSVDEDFINNINIFK